MEKIELTPAEKAFARDEEYDPAEGREVMEDDLHDDSDDSMVEDDYLDEPEEESPSEGWLDDEALTFAKGYNLSEKDLEEFSSMEELERFGELTDRRIANSSFQQYQQQPPREQEPDAEPDAEESKQFELYDPQHLIDENYDETTVQLGKALRETQEMLNRVMPLADEAEKAREAAALEQQATFAQKFHKTLDGFDGGLFGTVFDATDKVGGISTPHDENRRAVWQAAEKIIEATPVGNDSLDDEQLIKRAVSIAFGGIKERGSTSRSAGAAAKQSRRRRPTSSNRRMSQSRRTSELQSESDDVNEIAQSPKVEKMWSQFQRENGMQ
jgi:hypothetical protein